MISIRKRSKEVISLIKGLDSVLVSSENTKALADFYKDKVGIKFESEFEYGEEGASGYMFSLGSVGFTIMPSSEIKGKNTNPGRIMLNIEVDNCEAECKRLKDGGVNCTQEVYHIEGYGYVCTFEDPDGNYFQLVQVRAN